MTRFKYEGSVIIADVPSFVVVLLFSVHIVYSFLKVMVLGYSYYSNAAAQSFLYNNKKHRHN
jgi:hypothetical protein